MRDDDVDARRRRRLGLTQTRERAATLVSALTGKPDREYTVAELALISRFPYPSCATALAGLRAGGFVVRRYDPELKHQVWAYTVGGGHSPTPPQADLDVLLSIRAAAALAGVSEKLIRSRMDRGTLTAYLEKGRRYTTRRALISVGLLPGGRPRPGTERGMAVLVEWLSLRPGVTWATSYLVAQSGLARQACEIALAALEAAKLVERGHDVSYQNTVWEWVGPTPEGARKPGEARARPSPRPTRRTKPAHW
jgi:hypothetical protein